jgi:hypothetical protein
MCANHSRPQQFNAHTVAPFACLRDVLDHISAYPAPGGSLRAGKYSD